VTQKRWKQEAACFFTRGIFPTTCRFEHVLSPYGTRSRKNKRKKQVCVCERARVVHFFFTLELLYNVDCFVVWTVYQHPEKMNISRMTTGWLFFHATFIRYMGRTFVCVSLIYWVIAWIDNTVPHFRFLLVFMLPRGHKKFWEKIEIPILRIRDFFCPNL